MPSSFAATIPASVGTGGASQSALFGAGVAGNTQSGTVAGIHPSLPLHVEMNVASSVPSKTAPRGQLYTALMELCVKEYAGER